jgi:hypothetical protein
MSEPDRLPAGTEPKQGLQPPEPLLYRLQKLVAEFRGVASVLKAQGKPRSGRLMAKAADSLHETITRYVAEVRAHLTAVSLGADQTKTPGADSDAESNQGRKS